MSKAISNTKQQIIFKQYDKKSLLTFCIITLLILSFPGIVKCDMGEAISSLILFLLISVFICAGIGWWSRRGESKI